MTAPKLELFTYFPNPRVDKILVAAKYAGVDIATPDFKFGVDNKTENFLRNGSPLGKVPVLQTEQGCIFESNAIARYVARLGDLKGAGLYGRTTYETSQVDQWLDFATNELDMHVFGIWTNKMGFRQMRDDDIKLALQQSQATLAAINLWLETRTFLVGERLTLADIVLICSILPLYQSVPVDFRRPFVHLNRWFDTCINQPHFQEVLKPGALPGAEGGNDKKKGGEKKPEKKKEEKAGDEKKKGKDEKKGGEKKKEEKKGKEDKKGGDKKKEEAKAPAPGADEKLMKAVKKEGGKKAQDLAGMADMGACFQQAMLEQPGGDMKLMEASLEAMNTPVDPEAEERKGGADKVAKILISCNEKVLGVIVDVPEMYTNKDHEENTRKYEVTAEDWLKAAVKDQPVEIIESSKTRAKAILKANPDAGVFTIKAKDAISNSSFQFLRERQLVVDDDSDDDMVFGDDDMPGY